MDQPIRVLCVFSMLDMGGAESMCMNLYRHIDRTRIQFDFVKHTSQKGAFEDEIIKLGGRIYEAPTYKLYNHISYCNWWKKHLKSHPEHQIIHGHYFTISAVYFHVCNQYHRVCIAHSHAMSLDSVLKSMLVKPIPKQTEYRLACSDAAGKWLFRNYPFLVLKNAIETEKYVYDPDIRDQYRQELNLAEKFVVGTVANFSSVKNPFGLIELFSAIHDKKENSVLLWIGDGGLRNEIEARIREKGLTDCIILYGATSDVPSLLQAMDVFVFPSFSEGLGIVAIEAQAAGLPTYCSDTIPKDIVITPLCRQLPLNEWDIWADQVLNEHIQRTDTGKYIKDAGYDISSTSKWLEEYYLTICNLFKNP